MKLTPAQFAAFVRRHFEADTWYGLPATERRLRRAGAQLTAQGFWGAVLRAGWGEFFEPNAEYCWDSQKLPSD